MKKSLVEIYALAVCFGAMGFVSVYTAIGLYDVVGVISPKTTLASYVRYVYSSNERYLRDWRLGHKDEPTPSDAELTRLRLVAADEEIASERRSRIQDLVKAFCFIIVNVALFLVHWRIARKHQNGQPVA